MRYWIGVLSGCVLGAGVAILLGTQYYGACVLPEDWVYKYQIIIAALIALIGAALGALVAYKIYRSQENSHSQSLAAGLRKEIETNWQATTIFAMKPDHYMHYLQKVTNGKMASSPFHYHFMNSNMKELGKLPTSSLSLVMGHMYLLDRMYLMDVANSEEMISDWESLDLEKQKNALGRVRKQMVLITFGLEDAMNNLAEIIDDPKEFAYDETGEEIFKRGKTTGN